MPARTFVPAMLDTSSFSTIEPLFVALENRPLANRQDLEQWLLDCSELAAVLSEIGATRYIQMTCRTDDKAIEAAYLQWIEQIQPACKVHYDKLDRKFLACPSR